MVAAVRVECLVSKVWASENPDLFNETCLKFVQTYSEDYYLDSKETEGFIILIAIMK